MTSQTRSISTLKNEEPRKRSGIRSAALITTFAVVATGISVAGATVAQANGSCVTYWSGGGTWSGAPASGGTGTLGDPYKIGSQTDLIRLRQYLGYYRQWQRHRPRRGGRYGRLFGRV